MLIGILMILCLLVGFGLGLIIPYLIKKEIKNELDKVKEPVIENKELSYLPKDLIDEWFNGDKNGE